MVDDSSHASTGHSSCHAAAASPSSSHRAMNLASIASTSRAQPWIHLVSSSVATRFRFCRSRSSPQLGLARLLLEPPVMPLLLVVPSILRFLGIAFASGRPILPQCRGTNYTPTINAQADQTIPSSGGLTKSSIGGKGIGERGGLDRCHGEA